MSELAPNVMPALYEHTCSIYNAMFAKSKKILGDGGVEMLVYEGMLVSLVTSELNLSVPYYTKGLNALKGMYCIHQLRRGGGTSPSQWELLTAPTKEAFTAYMEAKPKTKAKKNPDIAMLQQQMRALTHRVNVLETGGRADA